MIARVWEGTVAPARADAYGEYLKGPLGILDYLRTPGNRGATLLRRDEPAGVRFLLVSWWDSRAAVAAYAGDDIEKPRYHPFDLECLIDPPLVVRHYEVLSRESGLPFQ
jgi:heme-degrading monooxygenase HmoA